MKDPTMDTCFNKYYKKYFAKDWAVLLNELVNKEVNNTKLPKLLNPPARKLIWEMCQKFSKDLDGTPGLACRLAEYYFTGQEQVHRCLPISAREAFRKRHIDEFLLTIMSSVCVATKLNGRFNDKVTCTLVQFYLKTYGTNATAQMIFIKEFKILQSIDFRPPLWTSVDTAVAIGMKVGMENRITRIAKSMDYVEYNLYFINAEIRKQPGSNTLVGTTQLAAGVVAAIAQRERLDIDLVLQTIASYCGIAEEYLKTITKILFRRLPEDPSITYST